MKYRVLVYKSSIQIYEFRTLRAARTMAKKYHVAGFHAVIQKAVLDWERVT